MRLNGILGVSYSGGNLHYEQGFSVLKRYEVFYSHLTLDFGMSKLNSSFLALKSTYQL